MDVFLIKLYRTTQPDVGSNLGVMGHQKEKIDLSLKQRERERVIDYR